MSNGEGLSEQSWLNPGSIFRGAPFWAWNEKLTPERLQREIQNLNDAGMGGFFMHSRYGLKTAYLSEEWWECVKACVEKARQLDMKAYLYDEDRWPSGAAGGIVTRDNPDFGLHYLAVYKDAQPPENFDRIGSFAVRFDAEGKAQSYRPLDESPAVAGETAVHFAVALSRPDPWYNEAPYLDTLSADAVAEFIHVTHQAYADRFGKDFGGVIPAIFTDEPNFMSISAAPQANPPAAALAWTPQLPRQFKTRFGYDLRDKLPELAFPLAACPYSKARHDYHRILTELFVENFSAQIGRWCEKNNIALTGHYLCEERLDIQVAHVGACMPHYEFEQWPGIDMLCDQRYEVSTVKQCTSVAAQLGRPRVLSETYGCTGWDWPLEGHKFNAGWQYVLGVNLRCPHLSWYSIAGGAKRDYPASVFPHSPWWKYYRVVEDYFGRLSMMLTQGKPVRDVLLLHPIETAWGLYVRNHKSAQLDQLQKDFDQLMVGLLDQHYDFDLGDESLLAKYARVSAGKLSVGKMQYQLVVVPPVRTLRKTTLSLLRRFQQAGGAVLFVGTPPTMVESEKSDELAALIDQCTACGSEPSVVAATLADLLPRRVSVTEGGAESSVVWCMLRQIKGNESGGRHAGQLLFAQSNDRKQGHTLHFSIKGRRPVVLWDAQTGQRIRVEAHEAGDRVEFDMALPPSGSALLSLGMRVPQAQGPAKSAAAPTTVPAAGPWKIELSEPNTFPLDFCRYRIGQGEWSEPVPVSKAETLIRQHFGLPPRTNGGCQPWYLAQTGRWDQARRGMCEIKFSFHVTDLPQRPQLAVEGPQNYQFMVNGQEVSNQPAGQWLCDEDVKVIDLANIKQGENELLLRFDYHSDMEIEEVQLLGRFGIRQTGPKRVLGAFTLVGQPGELAGGSWVGQGLDFYGAAVSYRIPVPEEVRKAASAGKKVRLSLPGVKCTAAAIHVGEKTSVLPWEPMSAEISEALAAGGELTIEVIGGRHNILGPLHVPWLPWTGPGEFSPDHKKWTPEYLLNDHGLMQPPVFEIS